MNYFGLFFSFMVPGIVIGVMTAAAVYQQSRRRARRARKAQQKPNAPAVVARDRLYVHDMAA